MLQFSLFKNISYGTTAFIFMTLGFVIPEDLIPPDPGPDNDEDDNNNDGDQDVNEDEENNERNCETPRGFSGDILENESETSLLSQLEDLVNGDDDGEAPMNEDEENAERNDNPPGLNTPRKSQCDIILNDDGSGTIYSMEELFSHIKNKNLPLRSRNLVIKPDGNCFFESCGDLANKFHLPVPHDKHLLRRLIIDSMKGHPDFLSWVQLYFHGEIGDFEEFIARLRKDGQYTDGYGFTTQTAAHVLGNDHKSNSQ